jgi:hypothetical protein
VKAATAIGFSEVLLALGDKAGAVEKGADVLEESRADLGDEALLADADDLVDIAEPGGGLAGNIGLYLGDGVVLFDEDAEEVEECGLGKDFGLAGQRVEGEVEVAEFGAVEQIDEVALGENVAEGIEAGRREVGEGLEPGAPFDGETDDAEVHGDVGLPPRHEELVAIFTRVEAGESDTDLPNREGVFWDGEGQGGGGVEGEPPLGDGMLRFAGLEEKGR